MYTGGAVDPRACCLRWKCVKVPFQEAHDTCLPSAMKLKIGLPIVLITLPSIVLATPPPPLPCPATTNLFTFSLAPFNVHEGTVEFHWDYQVTAHHAQRLALTSSTRESGVPFGTAQVRVLPVGEPCCNGAVSASTDAGGVVQPPPPEPPPPEPPPPPLTPPEPPPPLPPPPPSSPCRRHHRCHRGAPPPRPASNI